MEIRQDPVTKLWAREDGAVLMPPSGVKYKKFRWTFGSTQPNGYRQVCYKNRRYLAHRLVCRAFNGLSPAGKTQVDHINRIRDDNRPCNLHWVSVKENSDNQGRVDRALDEYGVRECEDRASYQKAYDVSRREERKAYDAARAAEMRAKGLVYRKGPDGKQGWYPRIRP